MKTSGKNTTVRELTSEGAIRYFRSRPCKYCRTPHRHKDYEACGSCQYFYKEGPHYEQELERLKRVFKNDTFQK